MNEKNMTMIERVRERSVNATRFINSIFTGMPVKENVRDCENPYIEIGGFIELVPIDGEKWFINTIVFYPQTWDEPGSSDVYEIGEYANFWIAIKKAASLIFDNSVSIASEGALEEFCTEEME